MSLQCVKSSSEKWNKDARARLADVLAQLKELYPDMKQKGQRDLKKMMVGLSATIEGVLEGAKEELLNKKQIKTYLKNSLQKVEELQRAILKLDTSEDTKVEVKHSISIKPGYDNVSAEAQTRLMDSITDESGHIRQDENRELSTEEKIWEDAEFHRIIRDQKLEQWENQFFGSFGEALDKYSLQVDKLLTKTKKQAILQIGPVIPTAKMDSIFFMSKLQRIGISTVQVGGYTIFEDQVLLAVNTDSILDDMSAASNYKKVFKEKKREIERTKDKLWPIAKIEDQLKEIDAELQGYTEEEPEGIGFDKENATAAREQRIKYLDTKKVKLEKELITQIEVLAPYTEQLKKLTDAFEEYKKIGRHELHGKMTDYTQRVFKIAQSSLDRMNLNVVPTDKLAFVSEQGVVHGQVTYFWVMPDRLLGQWTAELAFSKIKFNVLSWALPKHSKTHSGYELKREVEIQQGMTQLIHLIKKKGLGKQRMYKKVTAYLKDYRKTLEQYAEAVDKIWEEADEILNLNNSVKVGSCQKQLSIKERLKKLKRK